MRRRAWNGAEILGPLSSPCLRFANDGSALVLLVANLLHPFDRLALERLLDGDMGHGGGRRRAVPMFLAGSEDHDVARADLLDRPALASRAAATCGDDKDLTERVRMPGGARAGFEGDGVAGRARERSPETVGRCGLRR